MSQNPIEDLAKEMREHMLEMRLKNIEQTLTNLEGGIMGDNTVDFEVYSTTGGSETIVKATVISRWITYVEEAGDHSYVHMADGSVLHAVPSREELMAIVGGTTPGKSYIK